MAKDTKVSKSIEVPEVIEEAADPQIDGTSRKNALFYMVTLSTSQQACRYKKIGKYSNNVRLLFLGCQICQQVNKLCFEHFSLRFLQINIVNKSTTLRSNKDRVLLS